MDFAKFLEALVGGLNAALDRATSRLIRVANIHIGFMKDKSMEWFQYSVDLDTQANWAAGVELQDTIQVSQEAHFVCYEISGGMRMLAGATGGDESRLGQVVTYPVGTGSTAAWAGQQNVSGSFLYLLTDASSDRQRQDGFTEAMAALGPASHPTRVYKHWLLRANSGVRVQVRPNMGALEALEQLRISITLHGYKIYKKEMLDLTDRR